MPGECARVSSPPVERRTLLRGALAAGATLAAFVPARADDDHHHHEHVGHRHRELIEKALHCVGTGEICHNHCIGLLSTGDTSLKDCIRTVDAMLPMCEALAKLAALDAPRLKELARLCIDICDDCERECRKHAEHHAACKACGESCADCIKECRELLRA